MGGCAQHQTRCPAPLSKHKALNQRCSILVYRLRRWSNIEPALVQRLVFAGTAMPADPPENKKHVCGIKTDTFDVHHCHSTTVFWHIALLLVLNGTELFSR